MTGGIARFARKKDSSAQDAIQASSNDTKEEENNVAPVGDDYGTGYGFAQGEEDFCEWGGSGFSDNNGTDFTGFDSMFGDNQDNAGGACNFEFMGRDSDLDDGIAQEPSKIHAEDSNKNTVSNTSKELSTTGISFFKNRSLVTKEAPNHLSASDGQKQNDFKSMPINAAVSMPIGNNDNISVNSISQQHHMPNPPLRNQDCKENIFDRSKMKGIATATMTDQENIASKRINEYSPGYVSNLFADSAAKGILHPSNHKNEIKRSPLTKPIVQQGKFPFSAHRPQHQGEDKALRSESTSESSIRYESVMPQSLGRAQIHGERIIPGMMPKETKSHSAILPTSKNAPESYTMPIRTNPVSKTPPSSDTRNTRAESVSNTPVSYKTQDNEMPPPPAVTPHSGEKSVLASSLHEFDIPMDTSDNHVILPSPTCDIAENENDMHQAQDEVDLSSNFQDAHQDFTRNIREIQDKETFYNSMILDLTVQLNISHSEMLETQSEMLDTTHELESLINLADGYIRDIRGG